MKKNMLHEYFFCVAFVFVQLLGTILKINTQIDAAIHLSLFNIILTLLFSILISYPITVLIKKMLKKLFFDKKYFRIKEIKKTNSKSILYIWGIIILAWLPYLAAFYPGIFAYDVSWQLRQFWGVSPYNTHHPIIHSVLMGWVIDLGNRLLGDYNKGVAFYCLLQLFVVSGVVTYIIFLVMKWTSSKKITCAMVVYFILFPMWPMLGISTTKDTFFSIFYILCFCNLLDCFISGVTKKKCTVIIISLTVSLLFRNNAIYGVVLSVLFLLSLFVVIKQRSKKDYLKFIIIFCIPIFLAQGITGYVQNLTNAETGSIAEMLSVPSQQLARVYNEKKEKLTNKEKNEIFQYIPEEKIEGYRWQLADRIKNNLNTKVIEENKGDFIKTWIKFGLKYPREYIEATLCNTLPLWYIWDESMVTVHSCYMEYNVKDVTEGKVVRNSLFPGLGNFLSNLFGKGYILQVPFISMLFLPAIYVWVIVAIVFFMLKYKYYHYLILPVFLLGYIITLLAGPCILPRYCMNFMACVPLLIVFVYVLHKNTYVDKEGEK